MKEITNYISEKLKLSSSTKKKQNKIIRHPETKEVLRKIVEEYLEEDEDADMTTIDVSKITDMESLFEGLDPHDIDISNWNVSNVTSLKNTFKDCENFNSDLSKWDVHNVRTFYGTFLECHKFNSDLSNWNISGCRELIKTFLGCYELETDFTKWKEPIVDDIMYDVWFKCDKSTPPAWY